MTAPMTARDPLEAYLELYATVERRGRWRIDGVQRRLAAMVLATVPLRDPYESLTATAAALRRESGWFGPLSSPLRHCVAAMVLRRGLSPVRFHASVVASLRRMKGHGLPWGGPLRTLAAVLIALRHGGGTVPVRVFERMGRIHRQWKRDHYWLTGADDLPLAAHHALGDEDPEPLTQRIEGIYGALWDGGRPRGNALQLASHLLGVLPWSGREAAARFEAVAAALGTRGERIGRSLFDEVALLALLPGRAGEVAAEVLRDRDRLRGHRPRPPKEVALGIATGIVLERRAAAAARPDGLAELSALGPLREAIEAQQAAVVAMVAASSAASTAASAG